MLDRFHLCSATDVDEFRAQALDESPGILTIDTEETGPFHGKLATFAFSGDGRRSGLHAASHSLSLRLEAHSRDAVRLLVPTAVEISIIAGSQTRTIRPGAAGFAAADPQRIRYSAGRHLTVRADPARIAALMRELECDAEVAPILDAVFLKPNLAGLPELVDQIRRLIAIIDGSPTEVVDHAAFRAAHEQLVALGLAHVLATAVAPDTRRGGIGRNTAAIRRAEDYIRAHADRHVDLTAMARHAGLSLRSLQILFRANHDCTIVQYIRRHRLALARSRLERSTPETTVAEVARLSGFTHLGHFTAAYKAAYGEQPRNTLQRARRESR